MSFFQKRGEKGGVQKEHSQFSFIRVQLLSLKLRFARLLIYPGYVADNIYLIIFRTTARVIIRFVSYSWLSVTI